MGQTKEKQKNSQKKKDQGSKAFFSISRTATLPDGWECLPVILRKGSSIRKRKLIKRIMSYDKITNTKEFKLI
jgi:hypothetical protein